MKNDTNLHDDDFFDDVQQTQKRFAFFGILTGIFVLLVGLLTSILPPLFVIAVIYFFLAAAGVVPPLDFVPFVPYV